MLFFQEFFNGKQLYQGVEPNSAVAYGAALKATNIKPHEKVVKKRNVYAL